MNTQYSEEHLGMWPFSSSEPEPEALKNFQLSPSLDLNTMLATNYKSKNQPSAAQVDKLVEFANKVHEPLVKKIGEVKVISGYRSKELLKEMKDAGNKQVSMTSLHNAAWAYDIVPQQMSAPEAFAKIGTDPVLKNKLGEIAVKKNTLHISGVTDKVQGKLMEVINNKYYSLTPKDFANYLTKHKLSIGIGAGAILTIALGIGAFIFFKSRK